MISNIFINRNQDKYLVYFDKDWNCLFFPNCKGTKNIKENIEMVSTYLNSIDLRLFILHYKEEKKITKWNFKKQRYVNYILEIWSIDTMNYHNPEFQYKTMNELERLDPYKINEDVREVIKRI